LFESGSGQILFDPIFENPFSLNCYAFPDVEFDYAAVKKLKPDAVFISHYHDDHCSFESLNYLNRETPIYLYCRHQELFDLIKALGFKNVFSLKVDEAVYVKDFEVTPKLALDPDVDSLFHIKVENLNILNVVDAWIDPSIMPWLAEVTWDVVLWPFQTMREIEVIAPELATPAEFPFEWIEQLKMLRPRYIVPSSCQFIQEPWSWYRKAYFPFSYKSFQKIINSFLPKTEVIRLDPAACVELSPKGLAEKRSPLPWIRLTVGQDVDYEYDPDVIPQKTSEIAGHFRSLSEIEKERVIKFCNEELITNYNSMMNELSGKWSLILYDHNGHAVRFNYELTSGKIALSDNFTGSDWVTEAPLSKIFSALEEGESLSSLYIRMKGMPFDDISEDPLVASLFHGNAFEFQKQQLKKLLNSNSF
jgi:hypothetical protein